MTADDLLLGERKVVGCFTLPALRCAWERVLKKDAQDGDISDSVERFAEGVQERLEELAEELRAGTFRPSDLTRVVIPKKNGERFLDIPSVRDRIVERAILEHINPAIDPLFGATAFGYRPGLGVADAAQEVVRLREEGYTHVLRTDVHDCFPSLPVALRRRPVVPVHDPPRRMRDRPAGNRTGPGHGCPARRPRHPPQPGPRPDGGVPPTRGGPRRGDGGPQTRPHRVARPGCGGQGRDLPHRGGTGTDAERLRTQNAYMRGRSAGRLPLHQTRTPVPTGPATARSHHGSRTEMDGTGMAMMHLAAYDVHEDQRRAQLSTLLQAYGDRIQYSVFLLGITPEELVEIQSRAAGIIDENTDSLWIVRQCAACWEEARTLGQAHPPARVLHYAVM